MQLPIIKSIFGIMATAISCVLVCVGNMYNYHKVRILPVYILFEIQHEDKNQTSLSVMRADSLV